MRGCLIRFRSFMHVQSIDVTAGVHRESVGAGGQGEGAAGGGLDLADSGEEVSQPSLTSSRARLPAEKPSCHQSSHTTKGSC